eukprot:773699-Amphidinium_carterae.1
MSIQCLVLALATECLNPKQGDTSAKIDWQRLESLSARCAGCIRKGVEETATLRPLLNFLDLAHATLSPDN